MPKAGYPVGVDIQGLYEGGNLIADATVAPYSSIPWDAHAAAAVAEFETRTGRTWIASAQTRSFDPPAGPRGYVSFGADLVSATSVVLAGQALVANQDYFLGPPNADLDGKPFGWIELANTYPLPYIALQRRSLVISGLWGVGTTIPDDVFDAVTGYGAALAAPEVSATISGGFFERRIGDSLKRFGGTENVGPLAQQVDLWKAVFDGVATHKPRVAAWF